MVILVTPFQKDIKVHKNKVNKIFTNAMATFKPGSIVRI